MIRLLVGHVLDRLSELGAESVHCVVTSPPYYGLRDYGIEPQVWPDGWRGSLGLEPSVELYLEHMVAVFREVRRVLRADGTCWVNIGDSYATTQSSRLAGRQGVRGNDDRTFREIPMNTIGVSPGLKPKDLLMVPAQLALAMRADGWYLRSEIVWAKKAPMPESCTDRPTSAHEKVFLFAKSRKYFYDAEAVKEEAEYGRREWSDVAENLASVGINGKRGHATVKGGDPSAGRNMRNWWLLGPEPFPEAHFATFPTEIPRRCIMAGCPAGGTVLDPFFGAGTTGLVADQLQRDCIGIELSPSYAAMAEKRIHDDAGMFAALAAE